MQREQMSFTVYSMNKNTAVDFVCGREHILVCDTLIAKEPSMASYSIENDLIKEGVYSKGTILPIDEAEFENSYLKKTKNMLSFGGKTIVFFDEISTFGVKLPYRPHIDCIIVYGRNKFDVDKLLNCYVVDLLIIDGSVPEYLRSKIIEKSAEIGQKYYDVKREGAFVFKM